MRHAGRILFAIGLSGMGVLSLIYHGFALAWQPVPSPLPHRELLACISGGILVAGGFGLLIARTAGWGALMLAVFLSSWLGLHIAFRILPSPLNVSVWTPFAETVMLVSGGWILFASQVPRRIERRFKFTAEKGTHDAACRYSMHSPLW
jgi:hypothetical protein